MSSRVLLRSRLEEFYHRVLKEDMLTACNHYVSLRGLECSIVLNPAVNSRLFSTSSSNNNSVVEGKATVLLEMLAGQKSARISANPRLVDPMMLSMSENEWRMAEKELGSALASQLKRPPAPAQRTSNNKALASRKPVKRADAKKEHVASMVKAKRREVANALLDSQFRAAKQVTQLKCDLHGPRMWALLDKLREFYLPDSLPDGASNADADPRMTWRLQRGHDNAMPRERIAGRFGVWLGKGPDPLRPCFASEWPEEAFSTYTIPYAELLKFPDVEANYEALGSLDGLQLILRPTVAMRCPVPRLIRDSCSGSFFRPQDPLPLMNWFLGQLFNPYMRRVYAPAPQSRWHHRDAIRLLEELDESDLLEPNILESSLLESSLLESSLLESSSLESSSLESSLLESSSLESSPLE